MQICWDHDYVCYKLTCQRLSCLVLYTVLNPTGCSYNMIRKFKSQKASHLTVCIGINGYKMIMILFIKLISQKIISSNNLR